jgi:hypothetical protein
MNWNLIWLDRPLGSIARAIALTWGTAASEAITEAMARLDVRLITNPMAAGESRSGHERIAFESPLTVNFEVYEEERTVVVTRAAYTPPRQ